MKAAIIGGTGTLGSLVLAELSRRGHDVRGTITFADWLVDTPPACATDWAGYNRPNPWR